MGLFSKKIEEKVKANFLQILQRKGTPYEENGMIVKVPFLYYQPKVDELDYDGIYINFKYIKGDEILLRVSTLLKIPCYEDWLEIEADKEDSQFNTLQKEMKKVKFYLEFIKQNELRYPVMCFYAAYGGWTEEELFDQVEFFAKSLPGVKRILLRIFMSYGIMAPMNEAGRSVFNYYVNQYNGS